MMVLERVCFLLIKWSHKRYEYLKWPLMFSNCTTKCMIKNGPSNVCFLPNNPTKGVCFLNGITKGTTKGSISSIFSPVISSEWKAPPPAEHVLSTNFGSNQLLFKGRKCRCFLLINKLSQRY